MIATILVAMAALTPAILVAMVALTLAILVATAALTLAIPVATAALTPAIPVATAALTPAIPVVTAALTPAILAPAAALVRRHPLQTSSRRAIPRLGMTLPLRKGRLAARVLPRARRARQLVRNAMLPSRPTSTAKCRGRL